MAGERDHLEDRRQAREETGAAEVAPFRASTLPDRHRILEAGGIFLFSTHNQDCADHDKRFIFPELELSWNPARLLVRSARFLMSLARRVVSRIRFASQSFRSVDYSMINDACHDYATFLYYITLGSQRRQLEAIGFVPGAVAFDLEGRPITEASDDSSITLLARKAGGRRAEVHATVAAAR